MVGVPGRSKGCNSCRRRKIRCGGEKPFCKRCISTGRQCEGYESYPTFMIWTKDGYQQRSRLDDMKPPSSTADSEPAFKSEGSTRQTTPSSVSSAIAPLTCQADSMHVVGFYLDSVCSTAEFYKNDVGLTWLTEAFTTPHGSVPLDLALKALAYVRVAWVQQDHDLLQQGKLYYGQALESLQRALYDPQLATDEYIFVAARAMVHYEHFVSTSLDPSSWQSHVHGLSAMLKNRGPRPFQTVSGQAAMEDVRDTIMIKAYMDRKRVFCLDPDWIDLPWAGRQKDMRQHVCDIGFGIAALFEEFDTMFPDPEHPDRVAEAPALLRKALSALDALEALNLEHADATGENQELEFRDVQSVTASIHGWALQIALCHFAGPIMRILRRQQPDALSDHARGDLEATARRLGDSACLAMCKNILAAARFLSREEMSYACSRRLPFPLLTTLYYLKSVGSPLLVECRELYDRFTSEQGVAIASQLTKGVSKRFDVLKPSQRNPFG